MSTWTILKDFVKKNYPIKNFFTADDNGENLDLHISDEDYLTCNKVSSKFSIKISVIIMIII